MRVALVQCPPWGALPPLGLASLKSYLEQFGHEATCFDLNIDYARERHNELLDDEGGSVYARPDPFASESFGEWDFDFDGEVQFQSDLRDRPLPTDRWSRQILEIEPQVVGFSVQITNLGVTLQTAQAIQQLNPAIRIVFGGPNVAEAQQGAMALRSGIPDAVVEGEGEVTFVALLDAFELGQDLSGVAGIGRLLHDEPVWNERRPLIADVDSLPFPDFTDFDWSKYPNPYEIPMMASRGCVLNCAFCYETVYWKRFRTQSAERIVDEINHQVSQHPLRSAFKDAAAPFHITFADSLVNGHLGGLKRMAELLIERKTFVSWSGQATINTKMDAEFFQILASSGCTGLSFGLESGSQHVLESMGKRFQIADATDFFQRVHAAGISVVANIMVGFPTETRADFLETLRFLRRIRRMIFMVNNVSPTGVPGGSRIHTSPEKYGVTPLDLAGWNASTDFRWESTATGTERDRQRRLKILHLWMSLMRIPHQRLARERTPRGAAHRREIARRNQQVQPWHVKIEPRYSIGRFFMPTDETSQRIESLTHSLGEHPLLLEVSDGMVRRTLARPEWSDAVLAGSFDGMRVEELGELMTRFLDGEVTFEEIRDASGVNTATIRVMNPRPDHLAGINIYTFPPAPPARKNAKRSGAQTNAFFPLRGLPEPQEVALHPRRAQRQ